MLQSDPKPYFMSACTARGGTLFRARAQRMGFVVSLLAAIVATPIILFVGASVF